MYHWNNRPKTIEAPNGSPTEPEYTMTIDEKGHKILKKTGETNTYNLIQESLEQTKIENILRRAEAGDPFAINVKNGQYLDVTDVPNTLAEAQNFVIKASQEFEKLPIDIRRKFDMSPEKYIASFGSEAWAAALGIKLKKEDPAPAEEIKEGVTDESKQ